MGRIQSSVGLITGMPIAETMKKLMAISARPRDLLVERTEQLQEEQVAISELTALAISTQFAFDRLGSSELFDRKEVTSSDDSLLSAETTGSPAAGSYQFTPVRQAQAHQLLSSGFAASDQALGGGEIALGFGGFVDKGRSLDDLNGGQGIQRGKIRVIDRSGASSVIDLRFAKDVDDVLEAINSNLDINVAASTDGDRLRLTDRTGQSVSNLKVQEVGLGTTAADLGLSGIDVADAQASGRDILGLHDELALSELNDGTGVHLKQGVADLEVTLRDGSSPLEIEFFAQTKGPTQSSATTDAQNGVDAQFTITSVESGEDGDGYEVVLVDDEDISSGSETVEVDTTSKQITFNIDAGSTRAAHLIRALNDDATASQFFTGSISEEGDGTGVVDASDTATTSGGAIEYADETTVGELLDTINAADPQRLQARISDSGDHLELIDLTSGSGTFSVNSMYGGSVAEQLGFTEPADEGVITGERRLSGLKTVLLDSLGGGRGLGSLGSLSLTDRAGSSATVDLASAETLEDVVAAINEASTSIVARTNQAGNGIALTDTSEGSGNLVVANADSTNTADALRIAVDSAVDQVDSGSLDLQTFHEQLSLDSLNHGRGVGRGSFLITDSDGRRGAVNLRASGAESVGDVLDLINGLSIGVQARINDAGDGLLLADTAGGTGDLSVSDVGSSSAAADLKIAGTSEQMVVDGETTQAIDGSMTLRLSLDADDTLENLVEKINQQSPDIAASLFNSGSGNRPFRMSVLSQIKGSEGELLIDSKGLGVSFEELAAAEDALLHVGSPDSPGAGALASSSSNTFDSLVSGLSLSLNGTSTDPVSIDVEQTDESIVNQLELFVEQFNSLHEKVEELTFFDEEENATGILFGSTETLRIESDLSRLLTDRHFGAGPIQSFEHLGLSLDRDGKLEFDEAQFHDRYAEDAEAVEQFFTQAEFGMAAKFERVMEQVAGEDSSLLLNRSEALQRKLDQNEQRIGDLTASLEAEQQRLMKDFMRMEMAVSQMQGNMSALSQLPVTPMAGLVQQN